MNIGGILRDGWVMMLPRDDELPPLHKAARQGDLAQVSQCLASGADPNSLAIVQRSDREIEWMQADTRAESRFPVLHAAVEGGEMAIIAKLLDSGADPNIRWHCVSLGCHLLAVGDFGTALVLAARANRTDMMTLLMERGISPDADPEIVAELAAGNQADALRLLIERTSLPVDLGALFLTAVHHSAGAVVRLIQEYDRASEQTNDRSRSAQVTAEESDNLDARMPPAEAVVSPGQRSAALFAAAGLSSADIIQMLLASGTTSEERQEAFRIACRSHNSTLKVIRLLLERGADPRGDNDTSPALLDAVHLQKQNRTRLLLEHGAPVNGRYRYPYMDLRVLFPEHPPPTTVYEQMTLLMLAAGQGAVAICRLLLDYGAEPNARDAEGYTPLWYAAQERTGVMRLRGEDPEEPLPNIDLPGVIRLLRSHGADSRAPDPHGRTPLEWVRGLRSELAAIYPAEYIDAIEAALESGSGLA